MNPHQMWTAENAEYADAVPGTLLPFLNVQFAQNEDGWHIIVCLPPTRRMTTLDMVTVRRGKKKT